MPLKLVGVKVMKSWADNWKFYYEDVKENRKHITKLHDSTRSVFRPSVFAHDVCAAIRAVASELRGK